MEQSIESMTFDQRNSQDGDDEEKQQQQEQGVTSEMTFQQQVSEEEIRAAEMAEELDRLKRLAVFSTFVAVLILSFVFLPIFYPIILLLAGAAYACSPFLWIVVMGPSGSATTNKPPSERMLDNATDINHDREVSFGFDETRTEIRSCERARLIEGPPEGIYAVVYAAEYFGRVLRTEGELRIKLGPVSNGWEIQGQSCSASGPASTIRDGFLNAEGEMYWLVDGKTTGKLIQYRGSFDFDSNQLHDGEFLSKDNTLKGRIVRLYLSKATELELLPTLDTQAVVDKDWGLIDIEMVTKTHNPTDEIPEIA